jgi:DNA-binding LacI/PurR family transcriptional regulator
MPRILRELSSDGLLVNYIHHIPATLEPLLRSSRIPSVWINVKTDHNCVHPDDHGASVAATRRLLELGHRRIAFVGGPGVGHYSDADRLSGYQMAMVGGGLAQQVLRARGGRYERGANTGVHQTLPDDRLDVLTSALKSPDRPTAVLALSPHYGNAAIYAAAMVGLRVPQDLSVLTFSDWISDPSGLLLSFMHVSMTDVGQHAVALLCERIKQPASDLSAVAVPYKLVEGQTLARCRQ